MLWSIDPKRTVWLLGRGRRQEIFTGELLPAEMLTGIKNKNDHYATVSTVMQVIEASTYGNPSTFCKKKILYRMRPVFRASLWPDQWSYSVPLGIKWKIWTLSFHWYPLVSCGFSGLDTTASQSQAFFPKVENAENWPTLLSGETQLFGNFFSNGCHS